MELVSIIIPNHNYKSFLRAAVESLVRQTYSRMELLVVDDGSTDGSPELVEVLKSSYRARFERFDSILLRENRGKLHALNKGLPLAHGEVTVVLDADDYLDRSYIEKTVCALLNAKANNRKVGFAYTDCWLVDSECTRLARGRSMPFDGELLRTLSYIPCCATTVTRVLQEALPFDESIRVGTKHHKWRKIAASGWRGLYLQKPLFFYRMHDRNISGIGERVLHEAQQGDRKMYLLSGYWRTAKLNKEVA
jgi:glycosyltransferase involved in cell wall biosynthesis